MVHSEAMKFTTTERLLLINQFRILEKLDPQEADGYAKMAEILECGYTREYPSLVDWFSEELSSEACEEVIDILDMHRSLYHAYDQIEDKSGISARDIQFRGFDGNNEHGYLSYADFLINRMGHWQESKNDGDNLNSHHSTLDRYRLMLQRWKVCSKSHELTREDILQIIEQ